MPNLGQIAEFKMAASRPDNSDDKSFLEEASKPIEEAMEALDLHSAPKTVISNARYMKSAVCLHFRKTDRQLFVDIFGKKDSCLQCSLLFYLLAS